jgi:microcin C transport system substrate-binding protein
MAAPICAIPINWVTRAEKLDDRRIRFTLSADRTQETVMILAMMPVLSKAWWSHQDLNKTILTPPNATGPYKITAIDVGRRLVLERNPDYWAKDLPVAKGLYNFDRIVFDYFRNQTTAFESFNRATLISGLIPIRRIGRMPMTFRRGTTVT